MDTHQQGARGGRTQRLLPALVMVACAAPRVTPGPTIASDAPGPFGEQRASDTLVLPRSALVHLVAAAPTPFDGSRLLRDDTGLLGAIGLHRGDAVDTADPEGLVDSWFETSLIDIEVTRLGQPVHIRCRIEGPPVDPPAAPMTTAGEPSRPPHLVLPEADGDVVIDRAQLVHLPATVATPLRDDHQLPVGYRVTGPLFDALGVDTVTQIDGVPMASDDAWIRSIEAWFSAPDTVVSTSAGRSVHLHFAGAETPAPGAWVFSIALDTVERRIRSGIEIEGDRVTVPSELLEPLLTLDGLRRRTRPDAGVWAVEVFGPDLADLLDIGADEAVVAVDDQPLNGLDDVATARRALLTGPVVPISLSTNRTLTLVVSRPRAAQPDYRLPQAADVAPEPMRGLTRDGDSVTARRLSLRTLLGSPPTAEVRRGLDGTVVGLSHDPHPLWGALGVPLASTLTTLGDTHASTPDQLDAWVASLCTADHTAIGWASRDGEGHLDIALVGPGVPCP